MIAMWALVAPSLAGPVTMGLFVGSNQAGEGQQPLSYAMDDVRRVVGVLGELGELDPEHTVVLEDPDADEVLYQLRSLGEALRERSSRAEQTVLVFYYSGHAKSRALTLGASTLALGDLRRELEALPSTVTLALLDACQSGAISNVKGVRPAESFSYTSAEVLPTEGLAVMASSTATELSQESDALRGSYFTHHLVTGLRGPADADGDGAVTLGEAYAYAQRSTLVTTAATRTGSQHVTLETQLRGRGDLVLTRPVSSDAWLALDVPWTGRMLVVRNDGEIVVAEVIKQEAPFRLAVPAGRYTVLAQSEDGPVSCAVSVGSGAEARLSEAPCRPVEEPGATTVKTPPKTMADRRRAWRAERVALEYRIGVLGSPNGRPFHTTLDAFGFDTNNTVSSIHTLGLAVRLRRRLALALTAGQLASLEFTREIVSSVSDATATDTYEIRAHRLGAYARVVAPIGVPAVVAYAQAGPGLTYATSSYGSDTGEGADDTHLAPHFGAAAGLQLMIRTRSIQFGVFGSLEWIASPLARNELGQAADVGGITPQAGLRAGW